MSDIPPPPRPTTVSAGPRAVDWANNIALNVQYLQQEEARWLEDNTESEDAPMTTVPDMTDPAPSTYPTANAPRSVSITHDGAQVTVYPNGILQDRTALNRYVVLHTTEGGVDGSDGSARAVANWLNTFTPTDPQNVAGYHYIVDESETIMYLDPETTRAWHAIFGNDGVGVAVACRTSDWATMPTSRRDNILARIAAISLPQPVPPLRIYTTSGYGWVGHGDIQDNRTDPGPDFPWAMLFNAIAPPLA